MPQSIEMVGTAFPHHDRAAHRTVHFEAGDPIPVGHSRVALETDAIASFTHVLWFVPVHDDLPSIGGPED